MRLYEGSAENFEVLDRLLRKMPRRWRRFVVKLSLFLLILSLLPLYFWDNIVYKLDPTAHKTVIHQIAGIEVLVCIAPLVAFLGNENKLCVVISLGALTTATLIASARALEILPLDAGIVYTVFFIAFILLLFAVHKVTARSVE